MAALYNATRLGLEAMAAALQPPPPIDFLAWAEQHVVFEDGPFQGPWNSALFPFFDDILGALGPEDPCRYVTIKSSAQIGKTTIGNVFCLGSISLRNGSFLAAHPTSDNAIRWSKMKLAPLMRAIPAVRELFPQRVDQTQASVLYTERRDGLARLLITGANSPASLSQVTINAALHDDLSKWESTPAGDPEAMADSRCRAVADAKLLKCGTPLVSPGCRISKSFLDGSQDYPYVPCVH